MITRSVLLVAFHFPPVKGSSGVQRTLRFAEHLPRYGWRPIVLTINPRAYEATSTSQGNEIPPGLEVHRAFGLDAAKSLSLFGRYPRALAVPDRWASWRLWAVRRALRIVRKTPVDALWSTFPIATAHRIALDISRATALPWVAEFRDPMWQGEYPPDPEVNRAWCSLEQRIFAHAAQVVVTTPGAAAVYGGRFPQFGRSRIALIENGYDEETFRRAASPTMSSGASRRPLGESAKPITLLHSGLLYPDERDPAQFFAALASLKRHGKISSATVRIVLRASGHEAQQRAVVEKLGITDLVHFEPAIDYLPALEEMLAADGLLILQAANCNAQVPAKLYEYIRAGRPILALTDSAGDTAGTLERAGIGRIAPLDSATHIESALLEFMDEIEHHSWRRPLAGVVASFSREAQAGQLADKLNEVVSRRQGTFVA
jgi:glycosyltransferase involved in cell wall biosynthesis